MASVDDQDSPASHWEKEAFLKLARLGAIVFLPTSKGKYLMQVADADDESDEGKYRPPGGGRDTKDKNLTETIIREMHEEFAIPKKEVRKKIRFLGYEYRDEFKGNAVFEMRDHGLHPGVYQASNSPDEKIKLVEASLASKKYVGPDPEKLLDESSETTASKQARFITYDELKEAGKDADKYLVRIHLFDPHTEKTRTTTASLQDGETPEEAGVRAAKDLADVTIDETYVEQMPKTKDGIRQVRVLLSHTKEASTFEPDLTPDEMEEMADVQARLYHKIKPRLASMESWPTDWTTPDDSKGWVEWFQQYHQGRRSPDDERQIRRWKSFKARHGSQFRVHPTPRRAWAMVNWGIDPVKMLPEGQREDFKSLMEEYKDRVDTRAKQAAVLPDPSTPEEAAQMLTESQNAKLMTHKKLPGEQAVSDWLPGQFNGIPEYPSEEVPFFSDEDARAYFRDLEPLRKDAESYLEDMARRFPPVKSGTVGLVDLVVEFVPEIKKSTATGSQPVAAPLTGPEAIQFALQNLDLDAKEKEAKDIIQRKLKSKRPEAVKTLGYIDGLKRMGYKPHELMLTRVPVIPPNFRPFSMTGDTFVPGAANELYRDLINLVGVHRELEGKLGPGAAFNRLNIYDAVSALYGFGQPTSPKTRERGVSGFLKQVTGHNPKFSFVQRKMLSKDQDYVARGVIGVDPDLELDQIGVPEGVLWTLYSPYVQRSLVRSGMAPEQALRSIRDKTDAARKALNRELTDRPVVYSRAPSWHKFNVVAGYPKLIEGDMIRINPLVTTGLNADFDGDTINVHLPSLPDSVDEAKEKLLPSRMLFSIKDRNKVMPVPKQEFILGLYNAQRRPARQTHTFPDENSALTAIRSGKVALSDEVNIGALK